MNLLFYTVNPPTNQPKRKLRENTQIINNLLKSDTFDIFYF